MSRSARGPTFPGLLSKPEQRFRDLVKNIDRIRAFTDGMTYEQFVGDERMRLAVERCLLIISEAAVKLGELAEEACPTVPWPHTESA